MPEGDTVWLVANRLHEALHGHTLTSTDLRVPSLATTDFTGSEVQSVGSYGKHLLIRITSQRIEPVTLHSHLRMEGSWHLYRPGARWRGGPTHEIRAILRTESSVAVGYRLAELALAPTADEHQAFLAHLGPDILGPDFDATLAQRNLLSDPNRGIAEALLDQRVVAGLGMNYVAEVCFLTGVHPLDQVGEIAAARILELGVRLLQSNRGRASRVTTGRQTRGASSWVHGRRTCLRCGSRLARVTVGRPPQDRQIVCCPQCQPSRTRAVR